MQIVRFELVNCGLRVSVLIFKNLHFFNQK